MATYRGQDGVFQAITSGGTLASVTSLKSWSIEENIDAIESTVMGNTSKTYSAGIKGWTASCELLYDLSDAVQADLGQAPAFRDPRKFEGQGNRGALVRNLVGGQWQRSGKGLFDSSLR